jgi:predicted O-linked N-acetylglucosamine transferase (SPINDLY family)
MNLPIESMTPADLFAALPNVEATHGRQGVCALYEGWIRTHPGHPLLHVMHFNHGVLLGESGDLPAALNAYNESIRDRPDFLPGYINLASILDRLNAGELAISYWTHVVNATQSIQADAIQNRLMAMKQIVRVRQSMGQYHQSDDFLRQAIEIAPYQSDSLQQWLALRQRDCQWPVIAPLAQLSQADILQRMAPLTATVYADDPWHHLGAACRYSREDVGWPKDFFCDADFSDHARAEDGRLRIGYLSSDLRNHAIGYLMAEMFEHHDHTRVETTALYCGHGGEDMMMTRIKGAIDHWVDISALSDQEAAATIRARRIDILVDVNGHTRDSRTRLVAMRPAPIIVNWLGYPGTMGSPYHHYIIADDDIIPERYEKYYTEKTVRLPCYQPCQRQREVGPSPSRADYGLPEGVFVYCTFNGPHKLSPYCFERWIEILRRVPDSVLWMMSATPHIQAMAQRHGIDPARIIPAHATSNPNHLARYALADLFLDSAPYGAHTTGSDALWTGTPVLTMRGRSFASRVCASLVRAAGLEDFIATDPRDYVERAVAYGLDRARLQPYRARLLANRDHCVLFDMALLTKTLENLYDGMWADWSQGRLPKPDLTNLDLYLEIAAMGDHERQEYLTFSDEDYDARFRAAIARRHLYAHVPPDRRLWPAS